MQITINMKVIDVWKDNDGITLGWFGLISDTEGRKVKIYHPRNREEIEKDRIRIEREKVFGRPHWSLQKAAEVRS